MAMRSTYTPKRSTRKATPAKRRSTYSPPAKKAATKPPRKAVTLPAPAPKPSRKRPGPGHKFVTLPHRPPFPLKTNFGGKPLARPKKK